MKNCLQTKLKVSVQNDNLPILNNLRLEYKELSPNTTYYYPGVKINQPVVLTINGDATWNPAQNVSYIPDSGNKKIRLDGEDYHSGIEFTTGDIGGDVLIDLSDEHFLTYYNSSINKQTTNTLLDVSNFKYLTNLGIVIGNSALNIKGDINDLSELVGLTRLELNASSISTSLYGDISSLSKLTNLTSLKFQRATAITGNLNNLLDALYANGKNSGQLTVNMRYNTNIVYTGTKTLYTTEIVFTFDENGWSENE